MEIRHSLDSHFSHSLDCSQSSTLPLVWPSYHVTLLLRELHWLRFPWEDRLQARSAGCWYSSASVVWHRRILPANFIVWLMWRVDSGSRHPTSPLCNHRWLRFSSCGCTCMEHYSIKRDVIIKFGCFQVLLENRVVHAMLRCWLTLIHLTYLSLDFLNYVTCRWSLLTLRHVNRIHFFIVNVVVTRICEDKFQKIITFNNLLMFSRRSFQSRWRWGIRGRRRSRILWGWGRWRWRWRRCWLCRSVTLAWICIFHLVM